jgi:hypothetical protein
MREEVKKMNKMVLGMAVALIAIAMLATPVLADSARKIEGVTAAVSGTVMDGWASRITNPGEVRHYKDWTWTGAITLSIPGEAPLVGRYLDTIDGMVFPVISDDDGVEHNQGWGIWHFYEVWAFPLGTFEGTAQFEQLAPSFAAYESRIVLHGTGAYEGWRLVLTKIQGVPYEGYLMKP